jgi:hypothetical protein
MVDDGSVVAVVTVVVVGGEVVTITIPVVVRFAIGVVVLGP